MRQNRSSQNGVPADFSLAQLEKGTNSQRHARVPCPLEMRENRRRARLILEQVPSQLKGSGKVLRGKFVRKTMQTGFVFSRLLLAPLLKV